MDPVKAAVQPCPDARVGRPSAGVGLLEAAGSPPVLATLILLFSVLQGLYGAHLPLFGDEAY